MLIASMSCGGRLFVFDLMTWLDVKIILSGIREYREF